MIHHQMELYNLLIPRAKELFLQFNKWLEKDTMHIAIQDNKDIKALEVLKWGQNSDTKLLETSDLSIFLFSLT